MRVTVLRTTDQHTATKTFHRHLDGRIREQSYSCGYRFRHGTAEISSIDDLFELVQILEYETDSAFLIQGEVIPQFCDNDEITRTLHDLPERGQVAMLRPIPEGSRWFCADFDKIELPEGMTPQQGVEMLVQTLPDEFHNVTYVFQLSSSAGVTGIGVKWCKRVDEYGQEAMVEEEFEYPGFSKISAHVFFWLSKPQTALAQWAKNFNAMRGRRIIDPAFLETVQPNYCCRPRFIGMDDPVPGGRSGLVRKTADAVDLVWIDPPLRHVIIDDVARKVGSHVTEAGKTYIVTPSLQDRVAMIGTGGSFREPLKSALGYYFWLRGHTADEQEIKRIIRNAPVAWGGRDYLGEKLDDLVAWFASRNTHEPMKPGRDDLLLARMIEWRKQAPRLPDGQPDEVADWVFDIEDTLALLYLFIEGECGLGKTEWLIDRVATRPGRYLICLPRIEMIREVRARLLAKYPAVERSHLIYTIYSEKGNDVRDVDDDPEDEFAANGTTVTHQVKKFREHLRTNRPVVLFVTHAGMLLSDWHAWTDFEMFIDEIPEPYVAGSYDFSNSGDTMRRYIEPHDSETNYHRLGLTDEGWHKVGMNGHFDDNEHTLKCVLEAIKRPNTTVYVHKAGWDAMTQEVMIMRLLCAGFVRFFRSVTIMGDEFRKSMLALAFANKYAVDWQPHPDWRPTRTRTVPLKERARIFYFASKEELRGSMTGYETRQLIPKIVAWLRANVRGQTLITTNRRYERLFDNPIAETADEIHQDGVHRTIRSKKIDLLWVPPKQAGTDIYKTLTNVAFFAAMRPGNDEVGFVQKSLLITQDEIIGWREHNAMFQFVMRGNLRIFESPEIGDVYVYDEYQAEYLRDRFGGCREFTHITGVIPVVKLDKGGRPMKSDASAETVKRRERRRRAKEGGGQTT